MSQKQLIKELENAARNSNNDVHAFYLLTLSLAMVGGCSKDENGFGRYRQGAYTDSISAVIFGDSARIILAQFGSIKFVSDLTYELQ